jgi:phosphoribosylformylglycinamidine synthase
VPVAVAHGEGLTVFESPKDEARAIAALRFVDGNGHATERYP